MHIATSGQSEQSFLFCSSGQQGISADISVIETADSLLAAAGVASGATTSPTIRKSRATDRKIDDNS